MTDYWFVYDLATGALRWPGTGPEGSATAQVLPEGLGLIDMPFDAYTALTGAEPDLGPLKLYVKAMVDAAAGVLRKRHITDIPGQQATYLTKAQEAKAWIAATDPDPADYPYLRHEADATGQTIAAVAADIVLVAGLWLEGDAMIEGARRGAAVAIAAATNVAQIVAAARIDWNALLASIAVPPGTPEA
ncbi:hypothetical protein [Sphingomonas sp.]|uniref:hypothetical protein n=1 Tax=Sphingomonas sp. TaxID=28214 RepID=UPI000DB07504|nr:hypothetical protein [Sphingomonas sp.]PZU10919.1 MAG: hypothetical protein DI605_04695 [Sphingomonas sp.]